MRQWYKTALKWVSVAAALASMAAGGAVANAATSDDADAGNSRNAVAGTAVDAATDTSAKASEGTKSLGSRGAGARGGCTIGVSTIAQCFPDPGMAQAVADVKYVGVDEVFTQAYADNVTVLDSDGDIADEKVKSLEGVQYLHYLTNVKLPNNDISDLTPLTGLGSAVTRVDLSYNGIEDISPLKSMANATFLDVSFNRISALPSWLSGFSKVTDLEVAGNRITDLSPVSGMHALTVLSATNNPGIKNIRGLKDLPNLEEFMMDNDYNFSDASGFEAFPKLWHLTLECHDTYTANRDALGKDAPDYGGVLTDLEPLAKVTWLTNLDIGYLPVRDLTPLEDLTGLETLYAEHDALDDLTPLSKCTKLSGGAFYDQVVKRDDPATPNKSTNWKAEIPSAKAADGTYVPLTDATATIMREDDTVVRKDVPGDIKTVNTKAVWDQQAFKGDVDMTFGGDVDWPARTGTFLYDGTIKASFNPVTMHTVTFDFKNGEAEKTEAVRNEDVVAKPADPNKTGNVFAGWYDSAGKAYDFSTPVTADMTLTAKWASYYTVTFDLNYTGSTGGPEQQHIAPNGKVTKPADPQRTGYVFKGWSTTKDSGGTIYDFSTPVTADMTLYAQWEQRPMVSSLPMTGGDGVDILGVVGAVSVFAISSAALHKVFRNRQKMRRIR